MSQIFEDAPNRNNPVAPREPPHDLLTRGRFLRSVTSELVNTITPSMTNRRVTAPCWYFERMDRNRPPWLRVCPNTFSTAASCRGKARCPASLSPPASCSAPHGLACSSMSENRKNIRGLASAPLRGTTFSQPSRTYHRPGGERRTS
ncbi:hypothetical protein EYF80_060694 [Liparis tanakae]|uniref:Uncharacterized protein n=1 Tax=Liparis tanakae TaxID=230148 RepID=A0A4Z2EK70_9TELE|nr:hypothetical protein EYF80_060694 [Liparis tanakae]